MYKTRSILIKSLSILSLWLILGAVTAALGQDNTIEFKDGSYYYQGKKYQLLDLTHIMHERTDAYNIYVNGKRQYRLGRSLGISGLSVIGVGGVYLAFISKPQTDLAIDLFFTELANTNLRIIGKTFIGGGVVLGIIALSNRSQGLKNMKNAVQIYNATEDDLGHYQPQLNIGLTNNGVGFILNF